MVHFVAWLAPVKTMVNPVFYFTEATAEKDMFFFQTLLSLAEVHCLDII